MFDIKKELKKLPKTSGVYLMKDEQNEIIYIGKAKNLKNRVKQYFQEHGNKTTKLIYMVKNIKTFEYIVTKNEIEALILENNLIKNYKPKYNILLKDDKTFPYIKVTTNEKYPRILKTRKIEKDGAKYYGPYTNALAIKEIINFINMLWNVRICNKKFPRDYFKERPCLNYYIKKCGAPCNKLISEKEYNLIIDDVISFLEGGYEVVLKKLKKEMKDFSENLNFEKAIDIRNKILFIENLSKNQNIDLKNNNNYDIVVCEKKENQAIVQIFFIRIGKITGRENFNLEDVKFISKEEIIEYFIQQFYSENTFIPKEILLEKDIFNKDIISKWLKEIKGFKVNLIVPKKGEKLKLVNFALENVRLTLEKFSNNIEEENKKINSSLEKIKKALNLNFELKRIEAYDISNIFGSESVASMVVFEEGKQKRTEYRKFKIKTIKGIDDYKSIEEVITRRFNRYKKEKLDLDEKGYCEEKFINLPNIIFIDGGKGQISSVEKALKKINIYIPVCGMIKDDKHKTKAILYQNKEIYFDKHSEAFKLITRIQDEVHRFAIDYHKKLRSNKIKTSVLDKIKGVGPRKKQILLKHFLSIEKIKLASVEELISIKGISKENAISIYNFFNKKNNI